MKKIALMIILVLALVVVSDLSAATIKSFAPAADAFGPNGGTGKISVKASASDWNISTEDCWIKPNKILGSVSYAVSPNTSGAGRGGKIKIGDRQFLIYQSASDFSDVEAGSIYLKYIRAIYTEGITTGYGGSNYFHPEDLVTRGQMAAFIIRALYGENFTFNQIPYFTDVPSSHSFFKYVQKLKETGITNGTSATTYSPDDFVTREQMAAFIIRALFGDDVGYPATPYFTDVPASSMFFKYVQELKELGITTGTSATFYSPCDYVNREQMAAFIARAFLRMMPSTASANPIVDIESLGNDNYALTLDYSSLPEGREFFKGQEAPNGTWVGEPRYPVINYGSLGKVTVPNWPSGGILEFSFGTTANGKETWVTPTGPYQFPTGASDTDRHFRIQLGPEIPVSDNPVIAIENLGNGQYAITLDFSSLPKGTKFFEGQKAPNDTWIRYPVIDNGSTGRVVISNWHPGESIEFSFGTGSVWVNPTGPYLYNGHFKVQLN